MHNKSIILLKRYNFLLKQIERSVHENADNWDTTALKHCEKRLLLISNIIGKYGNG